MNKVLALLLAFGLLLSGSQVALAFSTEQASGQNSDGSSKFVDPDEQMPNFMTGGPDTDSSGLQSLSLDQAPVTPLTSGDYDEGAAAFNQAYSHLQKN